MSASPKIFITGTTGYIGGTVLETLVKAHPEYSITVLLRKVPEGFEQRYPKVRIIKGTFDDINLLSDIATESDIVIHGGKTKHVPSLKAIIDGLLRRRSEHPGFLIRLAGTSIIADWQDGSNYGELNPKVWSDIDDITEITSFPDSYQHRELDRILQEAAVKHSDQLKSAIICPPGIYGPGCGMGNVQSLLIPEFYRGILEKGAPFYTQSGANRRSWVHIEDLMKIYLALVEDAVDGGKRAVWGKEGYYFAESQDVSQYEMAVEAGKIVASMGMIQSPDPIKLPLETIRDMRDGSSWYYMGYYTWGSNTRTRCDRSKRYLGYAPSAPTLFETMRSDFLVEKARLEALEITKENPLE